MGGFMGGKDKSDQVSLVEVTLRTFARGNIDLLIGWLSVIVNIRWPPRTSVDSHCSSSFHLKGLGHAILGNFV